MTQLCVAIFVRSIAQAHADAARAAELGADLVEYRIDGFDEEIDSALVTRSPLPCIVTCRTAEEGGQSTLSAVDRIDRVNKLQAAGASYADIELITAQAEPERVLREGRYIISAHDFQSRPDRLYNLVESINQQPGAVSKIVWAARTIRDNIEAFELLRDRRKPMIALCMGEAGLISRVLAKKFGGFLSFASLDSTSGTAPGQISITDMKRLYRWDALDAQTRVYGVVGSPVSHSMSPAIHNASFEKIGENAVYLPLLVNPGYESFKAFMESFLGFVPLNLSGLSVTIPHKENALRYLKEIGATVDPLGETIGAINTIVIEPDASASFRQLRGLNTDYSAIVRTICDALSIQPEALAGRRVAVIGAGGTSKATVAALAALSATVVVYNRTRDKADALATQFNGTPGKVVAADMTKLCDSCCEIYINTTSLGMSPKTDESAWGDKLPKLTSDPLAFDVIYNPLETKFLQQAAAAGAKTVGGLEMFVHQAAAQFEAWTGKPAPRELMKRIVLQRLSS